MDAFYHITSAITHPAIPDDTWENRFRSQYPCGHRPTEHALDVMLKDVGEDAPLGLVSVGAGAIIRTHFIDLLGSAGQALLEFGKVFDTCGQCVAGIHTLGTDYTLRLRGGPKSTRQFCNCCGQLLYYPFGNRYILKSNLIDRPLYYGAGLMFGLLVKDDLYESIKPLRLRSLYIAKVPVFDIPQDGLPVDLSQVTPADLRESRRTV
jgi:hypothetical protein